MTRFHSRPRPRHIYKSGKHGGAYDRWSRGGKRRQSTIERRHQRAAEKQSGAAKSSYSQNEFVILKRLQGSRPPGKLHCAGFGRKRFSLMPMERAMIDTIMDQASGESYHPCRLAGRESTIIMYKFMFVHTRRQFRKLTVKEPRHSRDGAPVHMRDLKPIFMHKLFTWDLFPSTGAVPIRAAAFRERYWAEQGQPPLPVLTGATLKPESTYRHRSKVEVTSVGTVKDTVNYSVIKFDTLHANYRYEVGPAPSDHNPWGATNTPQDPRDVSQWPPVHAKAHVLYPYAHLVEKLEAVTELPAKQQFNALAKLNSRYPLQYVVAGSNASRDLRNDYLDKSQPKWHLTPVSVSYETMPYMNHAKHVDTPWLAETSYRHSKYFTKIGREMVSTPMNQIIEESKEIHDPLGFITDETHHETPNQINGQNGTARGTCYVKPRTRPLTKSERAKISRSREKQDADRMFGEFLEERERSESSSTTSDDDASGKFYPEKFRDRVEAIVGARMVGLLVRTRDEFGNSFCARHVTYEHHYSDSEHPHLYVADVAPVDPDDVHVITRPEERVHVECQDKLRKIPVQNPRLTFLARIYAHVACPITFDDPDFFPGIQPDTWGLPVLVERTHHRIRVPWNHVHLSLTSAEVGWTFVLVTPKLNGHYRPPKPYYGYGHLHKEVTEIADMSLGVDENVCTIQPVLKHSRDMFLVATDVDSRTFSWIYDTTSNQHRAALELLDNFCDSSAFTMQTVAVAASSAAKLRDRVKPTYTGTYSSLSNAKDGTSTTTPQTLLQQVTESIAGVAGFVHAMQDETPAPIAKQVRDVKTWSELINMARDYIPDVDLDSWRPRPMNLLNYIVEAMRPCETAQHMQTRLNILQWGCSIGMGRFGNDAREDEILRSFNDREKHHFMQKLLNTFSFGYFGNKVDHCLEPVELVMSNPEMFREVSGISWRQLKDDDGHSWNACRLFVVYLRHRAQSAFNLLIILVNLLIVAPVLTLLTYLTPRKWKCRKWILTGAFIVMTLWNLCCGYVMWFLVAAHFTTSTFPLITPIDGRSAFGRWWNRLMAKHSWTKRYQFPRVSRVDGLDKFPHTAPPGVRNKWRDVGRVRMRVDPPARVPTRVQPLDMSDPTNWSLVPLSLPHAIGSKVLVPLIDFCNRWGGFFTPVIMAAFEETFKHHASAFFGVWCLGAVLLGTVEANLHFMTTGRKWSNWSVFTHCCMHMAVAAMPFTMAVYTHAAYNYLLADTQPMNLMHYLYQCCARNRRIFATESNYQPEATVCKPGLVAVTTKKCTFDTTTGAIAFTQRNCRLTLTPTPSEPKRWRSWYAGFSLPFEYTNLTVKALESAALRFTTAAPLPYTPNTAYAVQCAWLHSMLWARPPRPSMNPCYTTAIREFAELPHEKRRMRMTQTANLLSRINGIRRRMDCNTGKQKRELRAKPRKKARMFVKIGEDRINLYAELYAVLKKHLATWWDNMPFGVDGTRSYLSFVYQADSHALNSRLKWALAHDGNHFWVFSDDVLVFRVVGGAPAYCNNVDISSCDQSQSPACFQVLLQFCMDTFPGDEGVEWMMRASIDDNFSDVVIPHPDGKKAGFVRLKQTQRWGLCSGYAGTTLINTLMSGLCCLSTHGDLTRVVDSFNRCGFKVTCDEGGFYRKACFLKQVPIRTSQGPVFAPCLGIMCSIGNSLLPLRDNQLDEHMNQVICSYKYHPVESVRAAARARRVTGRLIEPQYHKIRYDENPWPVSAVWQDYYERYADYYTPLRFQVLCEALDALMRSRPGEFSTLDVTDVYRVDYGF